MTKKKTEKLSNLNISFGEDRIKRMILSTKKREAPQVDIKTLGEDMESISTQYFMHVENTRRPTPKQIQKALKETNAALEKVAQKLGIVINAEVKKKRKNLRTDALKKISQNKNISKEEKEAIFITSENLGFDKVEKDFIRTYDTVFQRLDAHAHYLDVRNESDPFGNFVLSFYRDVVIMKEISEQAAQSSPCLSKTKKESYTAEQWLTEKLISIYETHFKANFTIAKPPTGGKHNSPGIRFVQSCIKELGLENHISTDGDAIVKNYQRLCNKKNQKLDEIIKSATPSKR